MATADEPRPAGARDRVAVRDDLADVTPYGAPQLDVAVRLNTNETAEPPPPEFVAELARRLPELALNRYPDRDLTRLRERLASLHDRPPASVWAANGSNEILLQLLQVYGGPARRALTFRPGYSMYPELARDTLTPLAQTDRDEAFQLTPDAAARAVSEIEPDVVLLASPNNPTGGLTSLETIAALHDACRGLVVVDEAYIEFHLDAAGDAAPGSAVALLDELPRLVVVRTFSKAFRLAGLRLGYLLAHDWVVDDVQRVRLPYHLDAIKQLAGLVALDRSQAFLDHRARVAAERDRVAAALDEIEGMEVFPSAANFLLVRMPVDGVFDRLLEHGVLVRDFSTLPRLERCIRVTVGTPAENDAFLTALRAALDAH